MTDSVIPAEQSLTDLRQTERLELVPALYRQTHERLCVELALKMEDPEVIFARYRYTPEQALALLESPAFGILLEKITTEVRESGLSYRQRMRAVAEDLIPVAYQMANDSQVSSAVRADLIKWASKVADLEPKPKDEKAGSGSGLTLSITFAGQPPQQVVSGREAILIEQEG